MRIREQIREFAEDMEAAMREGKKKVFEKEGVFLSRMSPRELMEGAIRNLNQLQGPALNPGTKTSTPPRKSAADAANYLMTLVGRLEAEEGGTDAPEET